MIGSWGFPGVVRSFFFFWAVVFTIFFVHGMYVSATFFFLSFKINLFFRVSASLLVII